MFKYYLLKVLRNKIYLFWCLVFPLGIMACMNAAFGNIYNIENSIDPVKTIIVAESDSAYAEGFCDLVDEFADESGETATSRSACQRATPRPRAWSRKQSPTHTGPTSSSSRRPT